MVPFWIFLPLMFSGSGVYSPPRLRSGGSRSAHFTLGLPVSRIRLLAVRASLGFIETMVVMLAAAVSLWAFLPERRLSDLALYAAAMAASLCGFYSVGVLLSVAMDGFWKIWVSFGLLSVAQRVLSNSSFPPSLDFFRNFAASSPLITHRLPWQAMALAISMAAILFRIAAKIAEARDY
jgi:hypothetical protein